MTSVFLRGFSYGGLVGGVFSAVMVIRVYWLVSRNYSGNCKVDRLK